MFRCEKSIGTFTLLNNIVYKLQSLKYSATFKDEPVRKVNTYTSSVFTKLQGNNKRRLNKAVIKHSCKISFKDFWNWKKPKMRMLFFLVRWKDFAYTVCTWTRGWRTQFSNFVKGQESTLSYAFFPVFDFNKICKHVCSSYDSKTSFLLYSNLCRHPFFNSCS